MASQQGRRLAGRICVVAGATRGAGRGISIALGELGATVYCTGRSTRESQSDLSRSETIDETADLVTQAGGQGIAVRVDYEDPAQVAALFDRIDREHGRLDLLVNDVWGGDVLAEWGKPFWELDLDKGFKMLRQAVHTHVTAARFGAPLLARSDRGLLIEITDGDSMAYRGNLFYDLVKTTVIRLAWDFAEELRSQNVASLAVTPGFLRSEMMLEHFGVTRDTWRDATVSEPDFAFSETPLFVGRGVARLAADDNVMRKSGRVFASWTLAHEYNFMDEDGARPDWGAHFSEAYGQELNQPLDEEYYRYLGDWGRMAAHLEGSFDNMNIEPGKATDTSA